jgi:superoxide dismutase, Cu-Zn family
MLVGTQFPGDIAMRPTPSAVAASVVTLLGLFTGLAIHVGRASAQEGASRPGALVVPIKTSVGDDAGTASFRESRDGKNLNITLSLKGLPPGDHAVHIHQNPVCDAPDFKGAGGHFNPDGKQHGTMNPMGHHNGDLPQNVTVGEDRTGTATFRVDYLTLAAGAPTSVLGHSIMVHEKADDMKTDPTGNAGNRIACGVINAANP